MLSFGVAFQYVGCASWHVGSANRHVAMQVDMWLCKSACGCASWFTIQMFKLLNNKPILYINSVSLSVCPSVEVLKPRSLLIKLSPQIRGPKNYSGPYFLLLFLRSFPHSNCRRSLLLTFTFTFVSAQQLPSSMGEVFFGFGRWVRRFGCAFFGLRV